MNKCELVSYVKCMKTKITELHSLINSMINLRDIHSNLNKEMIDALIDKTNKMGGIHND